MAQKEPVSEPRDLFRGKVRRPGVSALLFKLCQPHLVPLQAGVAASLSSICGCSLLKRRSASEESTPTDPVHKYKGHIQHHSVGLLGQRRIRAC